jgi:hypothetical protein
VPLLPLFDEPVFVKHSKFACMNKMLLIVFTSFLFCGCSMKPGSLRKLKRVGIVPASQDISVKLDENQSRRVEALYLGCGGVYIVKDFDAILIDPFFSNPRIGAIGKSILSGKDGKAILRTDKKMLDAGLAAINRVSEKHEIKLQAILSAHSHYDHLMDIPAIAGKYQWKPTVLLTLSGYNICHQALASSKVEILEKYMVTQEAVPDPVIISREKGSILIYPIVSKHNPHFRNVKFFSGEQSKPVNDFQEPYDRSKANLWLEGNTFSFLIDFVDEKGIIDLRVFVQSSSCNPPAGIPPQVLRSRPVDLAFIGIASYGFSPDYPDDLLQAISPRQVIWIHWEDFFRRYTKEPKTVRGTDVPGFFELPCIQPYKISGKILWPRVKLQLVY